MKIKDYSIIETKLIEDLFTVCNAVNEGNTDFKALRQSINRLKLKSLIPIIENSWNEGQTRSLNLTLEDYINNTIIE